MKNMPFSDMMSKNKQLLQNEIQITLLAQKSLHWLGAASFLVWWYTSVIHILPYICMDLRSSECIDFAFRFLCCSQCGIFGNCSVLLIAFKVILSRHGLVSLPWPIHKNWFYIFSSNIQHTLLIYSLKF